MYSYKQLQCFVNVVEEGGFTKAALKLYMTQPAISWQIKTIEQEVGLQLIERSERKLNLTEAGQLFYRQAITILNQYDKLHDEMKQFKNMDIGKLCVGASTLPGEYFLAEPLARFNNAYPLADVEMRIAGSEDIVELVCNEAIHLGIVGFNPQQEALMVRPYRHDEIVCIAPINHPLTKQEKVSLDEVLTYRVVLRETGSGTRKQLLESLKASGKTLKGAPVALGSTRAIIEAVKAGMGISWVSARASANENLAQIPIEGFSIKRSFYIIALKKRTLSPLARAFLGMLEGSDEKKATSIE